MDVERQHCEQQLEQRACWVDQTQVLERLQVFALKVFARRVA